MSVIFIFIGEDIVVLLISGLNKSPKFGNNSIRIRNQVVFLKAGICSFLLCWVQKQYLSSQEII